MVWRKIHKKAASVNEQAPPRYLCSHLVTLSAAGQQQTVNLEEIWENGLIVDCEEAPAEGSHAEIRTGEILLAGKVAEVERSDFGHRIEVRLSPLTPWSKEKFTPDHLVDPAELEEQDRG